MIENIKLLSLNIKEYFKDMFGLVLTGLITNTILHFFYWKLVLNWIPWKIDFFPLSFELLKVFVWVTTFLVFRWFWQEKIKTWLSIKQQNKYGFNNKKNKERLTDEVFIKDWIIQGNTQPHNNGLLVTNSNSGCLIKPKGIFGVKRIWKDFEANIEFEFPKQNKSINPFSSHYHGSNLHLEDDCSYPFEDCLGIIFRAQNLDDYFMIEIKKVRGHLVLRPHLRLGGNWDTPILNADKNSIKFNKKLVSLCLLVKNNIAKVVVGKKIVRWIFPTYVDTNLIQKAKNKEIIKKSMIPEVYFRNRSGMFGFRCYGNQIVYVKSLKINSI